MLAPPIAPDEDLRLEDLRRLAAGRMLEIEGLSRFAGDALRVRPDAFLNEIMTRLDRYTGNRFDDDVALLCIECP